MTLFMLVISLLGILGAFLSVIDAEPWSLVYHIFYSAYIIYSAISIFNKCTSSPGSCFCISLLPSPYLSPSSSPTSLSKAGRWQNRIRLTIVGSYTWIIRAIRSVLIDGGVAQKVGNSVWGMFKWKCANLVGSEVMSFLESDTAWLPNVMLTMRYRYTNWNGLSHFCSRWRSSSGGSTSSKGDTWR